MSTVHTTGMKIPRKKLTPVSMGLWAGTKKYLAQTPVPRDVGRCHKFSWQVSAGARRLRCTRKGTHPRPYTYIHATHTVP